MLHLLTEISFTNRNVTAILYRFRLFYASAFLYNVDMEKKVAFYTLGCRVNQYESHRLAEEFKAAGFNVVSENEAADIYIVNTCTVTSLADRKSRQYIRRAKRLNPEAKLVVMGCYSETNPKALEKLPEIDYLLGTNDKDRVFEVLGLDRPEKCEFSGFDPESRTRALIQIQSGCNRFCSYCVIPYARNRISCKPVPEIVDEAKTQIKRGYKEIVLTGINTALYEGGIEPVIKALNELEGDFRIRLSSLEPTVVNAEYVKKLLQYERLCHHFHLSAQSGSNNVIANMNRRYTVEDYLDIVKVCRSFDPLFGLTTDIIAGFPGETEEDFRQSLKLIEEAEFLHVHAFPYSKRPFTKAADFEDQIDPAVKKERNRALIELGDKVSQNFRNKMIGTVQRVLIEEKKGDLYRGHASNFCEVFFESGENDIINTYIDIRVEKLHKDGVYGRKE